MRRCLMLDAVDVSSDVVRMANVSCRFGDGAGAAVALEGVSVQVSPGSFVVVMGATGSGKSTLLNCSAGLIRPTAGLVWLAGRRVDDMSERALTQLRRDEVGFVFQSFNLLSELTVAQNVLLPRRLGARRSRPLCEVLEAVGLSGLGDRRVGELSGGQRQRVAIARALSTRPRVVFADEPTGALDPSTGAHVLGLLRRAVDDEGVTVVMVSHDPHAAAVSDRLLLLRSGRLVDDCPTPDPAAVADRLRAVSEPAAPAGAGARW